MCAEAQVNDVLISTILTTLEGKGWHLDNLAKAIRDSFSKLSVGFCRWLIR